EELRMALDARIGRIVVDNYTELDLLAALARGRGAADPVDVSLRMAPGIDPHTHRLISTGQVDTKFGFDVGSCAALGAVRRVKELQQLRLRGMHCHIGSQIRDIQPHQDAVRMMAELLATLRRREA